LWTCGEVESSQLLTEARAKHVDRHVALLVVTRAKLWIVAVASLLAMALLSLAVSRGDSALMLDRNAIHLLGRPPDVALWKGVADYFAAPAIAVVLIASLIVGAFHRILLRVGVFAGFAAAAFVVSELIVKPAVGERFFGQLSFPSGNVTAVCATSVAMWIALYPVLGKWARSITFVFGVSWTVLMSAAVVGAIWHTPLDCVGAVLLSLGVVTAGAAIYQPKSARIRATRPEPVRVMEGV
jgi:hypothetical protein